MSLAGIALGLVGRVAMSTLSRFFSPKEVIVDIGIEPKLFIKENLKKQNLKYHYARNDQVIARQLDGWRIALGLKWFVFTEKYVDKRKELILICKNIT